MRCRRGAEPPHPARRYAPRRPLPNGERWRSGDAIHFSAPSVCQIISNTPSRFLYTSVLVHSHNVEAERFEYAGTLGVACNLARFTVRRAVDLHDQPAVKGDEIDNISIERVLAAKFPAIEPPIPQRAPQSRLGAGLASPEISRPLSEMVHRQPGSRHCNARAGEGECVAARRRATSPGALRAPTSPQRGEVAKRRRSSLLGALASGRCWLESFAGADPPLPQRGEGLPRT